MYTVECGNTSIPVERMKAARRVAQQLVRDYGTTQTDIYVMRKDTVVARLRRSTADNGTLWYWAKVTQ